jgi:hypothetical protein
MCAALKTKGHVHYRSVFSNDTVTEQHLPLYQRDCSAKRQCTATTFKDAEDPLEVSLFHQIYSPFRCQWSEYVQTQVETALQTAELSIAYRERKNEEPAQLGASGSNHRWTRVSALPYFVPNTAEHAS